MIKLKKQKDYYYFTRNSTFSYRILYNYGSGRKNRYEVLILTSDDPIVIGRELPLKDVRNLIERYESAAKQLGFDFYGERYKALEIIKKIQNG